MMDVSSSIQSKDQSFDVLVIGGGINGVAIARECARAGKRVAQSWSKYQRRERRHSLAVDGNCGIFTCAWLCVDP